MTINRISLLDGLRRRWLGPMGLGGAAPFALGPAPVDLRHGVRAFSITRMAISGYAVAMHTVLWMASGRERWLWVAVMALAHTVVVIPVTNSLIRRSVVWTYLMDVTAMVAGVIIVGEPALMPFWTPIIVTSAVAFAGGREALKGVAIAAAGIPAAYLLVAFAGQEISLSSAEVRSYGLTTALLWAMVGCANVYTVGASVNRMRAELEETEAAREQARAEADDSARLVRTVADAAPVGLSLQTSDSDFVYVNSRFGEITGLSLFEIAERGFSPVIDPSLLPIVQARVTRALEDGTPFTVEYRTRTGRLLRHLGTPVAVSDGLALISTVQDLSAEREAARDLRRMSTALDLTATAVAMWDEQGRVTMANRVFRELWCGEDDPIGKTLEALMGPAAGPLMTAALGNRGHVIEQQVAVGDGESVWMSFVLADLIDSDNETGLRTMAARDVSDIVRSRQELEGLLASKDQFIASVSHELRTPLTAVVGLSAEMARSVSDFDAEELEGMARVVSEQSTEVAALVEDLLVAARADAGVLSIASRPIDLGVHAAGAAGRLVFDAASSLPGGVQVVADPIRVRQIVRNLVTNSMRYGGPHVSMEAGVTRGFGFVEVCDDGPEIPGDVQSRIFDAYHRAHEQVGTPDSVGLGLTVSRTLARMMGGDVTYRHDGHLSRFRLSLPLHPVGSGLAVLPNGDASSSHRVIESSRAG